MLDPVGPVRGSLRLDEEAQGGEDLAPGPRAEHEVNEHRDGTGEQSPGQRRGADGERSPSDGGQTQGGRGRDHVSILPGRAGS